MAENKRQEITVQTIMEKIRLELARRRSPGDYVEENQSFSDVPAHLVNDEITYAQNPQQTAIWRIIKKVQYKLQKFAFYDFVYYKIAVKFRNMVPKYKNHYTLDDFLRYHDEEFIYNAYWAILKRAPDPRGLDFFLTKLREGHLSKAEILVNLRYAPEGRKQRVKIKGMLPRFLLHSSYKVPIAGALLRGITALVTLPSQVRTLNALDAQSHIAEKNIDDITVALSEKVDARTLSKAREEIHHEMLGKANAEEIHHQMQGKANAQELTAILAELREKLGKTLLIKTELKDEKDLLDAMYVSFEEKFRGSREDIKKRMEVYLPFIEQVATMMGDVSILDLGCGRGEWLELLKEKGYKAKGVDMNSVMVRMCRESNLDATEYDVIEYLRQQRPGSIGAITGFHLVEHLPFRSLISLLDECLRVLEPGGLVIFETPNPENLMVGAFSFYFDPSHKNPLPPGSLQFFVEFRGFMNISILKLHKYSDFVEVRDADEFKNKWFYSDMDYSVIAYKNAGS